MLKNVKKSIEFQTQGFKRETHYCRVQTNYSAADKWTINLILLSLCMTMTKNNYKKNHPPPPAPDGTSDANKYWPYIFASPVPSEKNF